MKKTVFLNGAFLPEDAAKISIFDRGFLFADGVYEGIPVFQGHLMDVAPFLARLDRSLNALGIQWPMSQEACRKMIDTLIRKNSLQEGGIYVQITRGVTFERVFEFPKIRTPTCMAFTFEKPIIDNPYARNGIRVVTVDDIRWKRRDIKSLMLLGQCVAKEEAVSQGADEGWMVENGCITEGTASSAYIVKDGVLITRPLSNDILPGIRRKLLLELAPKNGIRVAQRCFTPEEAYAADEAFLSSATTIIYPIIDIDGHTIGNGKPGPITQKLRRIYLNTWSHAAPE